MVTEDVASVIFARWLKPLFSREGASSTLAQAIAQRVRAFVSTQV